jgi:hypothetical protein
MKSILPLFTLAIMTVLSPAAAQTPQMPRAQAQQQTQAYDRWCRFEGLDHGSVQVCAAYTYEQCMASRNPGDTVCFLNPRYDQRFRR